MATEMPIPQDYNRFIPGQGAASAEDDEPSLQELFDEKVFIRLWVKVRPAAPAPASSCR